MIGFEDVMKAFLQDDLQGLRRNLHPDVDLDVLCNDIREYLLEATMEQRATRCLKYLDTYEATIKDDPEDPAGVASTAAFMLHADLLGERQYDPFEHPEFMIFELKANILIRPNQLPILEALVKDPNSVKQAVTGIGKTSVILLLVALLKAKPGKLSILYFPTELFEDNTEQLQLKLGSFFERNVYELRYPPSIEQLEGLGVPADTYLTRPWELSADDKSQYDFMILNGIYQRLIHTSMDRGVVTSTKEAALGLQSQYKSLLKEVTDNPENVTPMQTANLAQLSKILLFLRRHGVQLTDEVDRVCDVRDKYLRAKPSEKRIPEFKSDAVLEIYRVLLEVEGDADEEDKLYLLENGQQDISSETRQKAIEKTAERIAKNFENDGFRAGEGLVLNYLLGKESADNALLADDDFYDWPLEKKDSLKIMQEEISSILSIVLSAKGGIRYGQCTDPKKVHEVVPYRLGLPRNNARQGLDLEVLSYTAQYYFQKGPNDQQLKDWIEVFREQAAKDLKTFSEHGIVPSANDLQISNTFSEFFYENKLEGQQFNLGKYLGEDGVRQFLTDIQSLEADDPVRLKFIQKFLEVDVFPKLKRAPASTEDDASSFLSMHDANSGASATIGGLMGIKALNTDDAEDPEALGRMMLLFIENGKMACKTYNPHDPATLSTVIEKSADNQVFVDGAGVFAGLPGLEQAKSLLNEVNHKHPEIKGVVFWDDNGSKKVVMRGANDSIKVTSVKESGLQKHELGMYCDFARSRGADQPLGTRVVGTVTVNELMDLDGLAQAKGRMRGEAQGQGTQALVPEKSRMKTKIDVVKASVERKGELVEENLVRRITAEMRNEVHHAMMERLLLFTSSLFDEVDPSNPDGELVEARLMMLTNQYKTYESFEILDSPEEKDLDPGEYFDKHKMLSKQANTMNVLESMRQRFISIAEKCNLTQTTIEGAVWQAILSRDISPIDQLPNSQEKDFLSGFVPRLLGKGEQLSPFEMFAIAQQSGIPEQVLQMIQDGTLYPQSVSEKAVSLPDAVAGLDAVKDEWDTEKWKESIGVRLPDKYLTGAESADQAQELEAQEEQEQEFEQGQGVERLEEKNLHFADQIKVRKDWYPWPQKGTPMDTLFEKMEMSQRVSSLDSKDNFIWNLENVGFYSVMAGFFKGILLNNNLLTSPESAFPSCIFRVTTERKPVNSVLVTREGDDVKVLGLDALDRNEVLKQLQLDRESGSAGDMRQAYVYDLGRRKVIATGANDEGIPVSGTPKEIFGDVLKLRLYNLELNYEAKELEELEKMIRESFPLPDEFLEFKTYFENSLLPMRHNGHIYYSAGNLKVLMFRLEKEAEEVRLSIHSE